MKRVVKAMIFRNVNIHQENLAAYATVLSVCDEEDIKSAGYIPMNTHANGHPYESGLLEYHFIAPRSCNAVNGLNLEHIPAKSVGITLANYESMLRYYGYEFVCTVKGAHGKSISTAAETAMQMIWGILQAFRMKKRPEYEIAITDSMTGEVYFTINRWFESRHDAECFCAQHDFRWMYGDICCDMNIVRK